MNEVYELVSAPTNAQLRAAIDGSALLLNCGEGLRYSFVHRRLGEKKGWYVLEGVCYKFENFEVSPKEELATLEVRINSPRKARLTIWRKR